ncbi:NFACT family protein [Paenibacillus alvei]|uniref:Rqc2 homolog RqcH n=1 Tax=Paenibacillus alvei TaxID=44250 RepID=A0ABT4GUZ5_PAEAL|nr:NFACT RNA binding domain-containing protein [Paenibacillus alvei]EJW17511.1 fibronectin-binding A domain protein [Paenibacillus alvei DSM 29]MCY9540388.1 NFACT family protein [Paenibacillus alvei]MCY9705843.1 NFACT family protein [Paenibacillus alvei]MCY9737074.1 NFACT family protein [Paenibacillus alvei]MCY9753462.1 NFACT family protein [Paenibacillus alvei]
MSLDGIVTRALVDELQQTIGARIHKLYQPTEHDLILHIRTGGKNRKLLLSANPTYPRVHFTEHSYMNPPEPPMFCMLMRKHCEGGVIEKIEQIGRERILHITVRSRDELGDESQKKIIIELTGRHSNIIIVDPASSTIIDGIHHVTPAISSFRIIMPGFAYTAPPEQHKLDPLSVEPSVFESLFLEHIEASPEQIIDFKFLSKWLVQHFSGVSPRLADEIVWRTGLFTALDGQELTEATAEQEPRTPHTVVLRLHEVFLQAMDDVSQQRYKPTLLVDQRGKTYFSALEITHINGETQSFDTMSECMEHFYGDKAERDMIKQRVGDLFRFLQQEHAKNTKKLDKLEETLQDAQDADRFRIMGELLFASLHMISRGDNEITLINYYDENGASITIPLDPLLAPSDNAQRYFKKYNKAKNSIAVVQEQMTAAREENRYFETLMQQLEDATVQDAQEMREELVGQGYLRDRGRKDKRKKKDSRPTVYCYTSSENIPIYVGKNNLQNEYVTNRLGKPNDTWLHTKDIPGSHVVIRSEQFGDATLEEAAQLAAYFSQAKHSSQVPVDYTLIRHVRKPNGAKPGFVIYERQKTLFITPDAKRIESMSLTVKQGG